VRAAQPIEVVTVEVADVSAYDHLGRTAAAPVSALRGEGKDRATPLAVRHDTIHRTDQRRASRPVR
jgi:hypothetical protein